MRKPKKLGDYPHRELCKKKPHLWKRSSFEGNTTHEWCSRCGDRRERPATPEEKKKHRAWVKQLGKPMEIHRVSHAYDRALDSKKGYEAMQAAERFVDKHPDRATLVGVDDGHFCSSNLVLITHEDPKGTPDYDGKVEPKWMGVSVHVIPQCTGENPMQFFLYPGHLDGLLDALKKIKRRMMTYPDIRRSRASAARWKRKRKR